MNLDGSPVIPMTTNVNKSGGYLEVIVNEVVWLDSSDRLIGSVSVMTRLVSLLSGIRTRLVSEACEVITLKVIALS
jgi:hypothetical protein